MSERKVESFCWRDRVRDVLKLRRWRTHKDFRIDFSFGCRWDSPVFHTRDRWRT